VVATKRDPVETSVRAGVVRLVEVIEHLAGQDRLDPLQVHHLVGKRKAIDLVGRVKAAVLPLPVWDWPIMSFP
jgi:hypothetical protein